MQHDVSILAVVLLLVFWSFGFTFIICEIPQRISFGFEEICDSFYQLNWYRFPDELNKLLVTFILSLQKPIVFECFGSIDCSRESFKKVSLVWIKK